MSSRPSARSTMTGTFCAKQPIWVNPCQTTSASRSTQFMRHVGLLAKDGRERNGQLGDLRGNEAQCMQCDVCRRKFDFDMHDLAVLPTQKHTLRRNLVRDNVAVLEWLQDARECARFNLGHGFEPQYVRVVARHCWIAQ